MILISDSKSYIKNIPSLKDPKAERF